MVSQIVLGQVFNVNGRNVFGGAGGSGFDTQALIESLVAARSAPVEIFQDKIDTVDSTKSALAEFQSLLSTFRGVANNLRNPPGVGNAVDNAFSYLSSVLTSNTSVAGSNYISVAAEPGVQAQTFSITDITSLAAATKQTTDPTAPLLIADANTAGLVVASGAAAGQFNAGTFTLNGIDGNADVSITLGVNDTLNDIVGKFNAVSSRTGIAASVVKVDDGEFILSFTGTKTGSTYDFDLETVGTVVTDPSGVLSQMTFVTTQNAADAEFTIDGVDVVRSSNVIDDVVDGVTITLLQETPALTTITATLQPDTTTARDSIVAFADAYNALKVFEAKQLETNDDGTFAETAILATNSLFRTTMSTITSQVVSVVKGLSNTAPDNITDIGISFVTSPATPDNPEIRNVLSIDEDEFNSKLGASFNDVRKIFEFSFASDDSNLRVFSRTNALTANSFTLNINPFATQVTDSFDVADADTQIAFTSPAAGQLGAGDIVINGQTISITNGMTLNQVKAAFDAAQAQTGVATTIGGSAGAFTLTFVSTRQTGKANLFDLSSDTVDADGVFDRVDITATGVFSATYNPGSGNVTVNLTGTAISGSSGFTVSGVAGTAFEGLVMVYGSNAASSISVTATQGISDSVYNILDNLLKQDTGALDVELTSIDDRKNTLQEQIDRVNSQVESYRELLINKFSALEQAIARVNQLLTSLDANDTARRIAAG